MTYAASISMITVPCKYLQNIADSLIGVPYAHLGRNPSRGLDCWGVVIEFFKRLGVVISDPIGGYREDFWKHDDLIGGYSASDFYPVKNPSPGSVVSMCINAPVPNHLGVLLDNTYILNSSNPIGVHRLRLFVVKDRQINYYRHKDLEVI